MDDLSLLLAGAVGDVNEMPAFGFHQGMIVEWNVLTGENVVSTQGILVPNVYMLNIGDTTNLAPNDVVLLFRLRTQYFILGRIIAPNSDLFASASVSFTSANSNGGGYALTSTMTAVHTQNLTVPLWANTGLFFTTGHFNCQNDTGTNDFLYGRMDIGGFVGAENVSRVVANTTGGYVAASKSQLISVTPGGTVPITAYSGTNVVSYGASAFNSVSVSTMVVYRNLRITT